VPLRSGAQATIGADDIAIAPLRSGEFARKTAWTGGRIALSGDTLAQAVAEFNRYGNTRLAIGDPAIAGLQVGGVFDIRDVEGFAQAVSRAFPVAVQRQRDGSLVLAGRPLARGSP
jgi:transmembrane sensor